VFTAGRDAWNMFGHDNAFARLIEDAGGEYVWSDVAGGLSITNAPMERALERGIESDVWIIGADFSAEANRPAFISSPRYPFLRPIAEGRVFVARPNATEPNPYWDHALHEPDAELADHIQMLHRDRFPTRALRFYRRLTTEANAGDRHD
jgi:iron complex transport system substrate-binding protein